MEGYFDKIGDFIQEQEGGTCNTVGDKGGWTNKGITHNLYMQYCAMKKITPSDAQFIAMQRDLWNDIFRTIFWDKIQGDKIVNFGIATIVADWTFNSGEMGAAKKIQMILNQTSTSPLAITGAFDNATLLALNKITFGEVLYQKLLSERAKFYDGIVIRDSTQKKFLADWYRRIIELNYFVKYENSQLFQS